MITEQSLLVSTCISPLKNLDWSLPHAHLVASLTGRQTEVVPDAAPGSRDVKQTVARHEGRSPVAVRPASTGWVPQLTIRWNLYSDIYACLVITSRRCLQTRATQCTACRPTRAAPCWTGCLQTRAAPCFTGCLQTRAAPCCTDVCKPEPPLALQDVGEPDPLLAAQDVCNQQRRSLPRVSCKPEPSLAQDVHQPHESPLNSHLLRSSTETPVSSRSMKQPSAQLSGWLTCSCHAELAQAGSPL